MATCPKAARDTEQGSGICFKCGSTEHGVSQCRVRVPEGTTTYQSTSPFEKYDTFQSLSFACFRGCSRPLRQANCPDDMGELPLANQAKNSL